MAYLQVENNIYLILNVSIKHNLEGDDYYCIVINALEPSYIRASGIDYYPYAFECEGEKDAHNKFRKIKQLLECNAIIDLDLVKNL